MTPFPISRPPVEVEKRKAPTLRDRVQILLRYVDCPMCGEALTSFKQVEYDHITPLALGGANEPINLMPLCPKCHRRKTDADLARIAKANRQAGKTGQQARRKKNGPQIKGRNDLGGENYLARKAFKERVTRDG